jgi:hypothetical protein
MPEAAAPVIHIAENSPEHIAYRLLRDVALIEHKAITGPGEIKEGWTRADRKWLLDTYSECLTSVQGNRQGQ